MGGRRAALRDPAPPLPQALSPAASLGEADSVSPRSHCPAIAGLRASVLLLNHCNPESKEGHFSPCRT